MLLAHTHTRMHTYMHKVTNPRAHKYAYTYTQSTMLISDVRFLRWHFAFTFELTQCGSLIAWNACWECECDMQCSLALGMNGMHILCTFYACMAIYPARTNYLEVVEFDISSLVGHINSQSSVIDGIRDIYPFTFLLPLLPFMHTVTLLHISSDIR